MNELEILIAARALIATPESWIKGRSAQDANGVPAGPFDEGACKFCTVGAMTCASGQTLTEARASILRAHLPKPFDNLVNFNDHPDTTHADVLALFDRAIAYEEAKHERT